MRFNRPLITALAVALAAALAQPVAAEDLIQVYDMARASDPQLGAADAQRLAARENVVQSRALLLPNIVGQATLTDDDSDSSSTRAFLNPDGTIGFGTSSFTQDTRQRVYRAQLDQSVFDYSRWTRLRGSKAFSQQNEATYEAALDALFVRVAQVYFDALTAHTNLEAAEAELTAVGRQLEQANQRFEVGLTAITDVHEAQARYDNSRANVIIARDALNDAYYAVEEITGTPVESLRSLADSIPLAAPEPPEQDAWVKVAEEQNPQLASRRFQVEASEADISTARAGHLPSLGLQVVETRSDTWGEAFSNGNPQPPGAAFDDTALGLVLNVPIFEGGATQSRVRQAVHNRDISSDLLEQDRRLVVRNTRNSFRNVVAGISLIEARRAALVSAQSALEATQAGFEVGTRTIVDVLISQQQLFLATQDYARVRHAFLVENLRLKQNAGVIEIGDLQAVNALLTGPEKNVDTTLPVPAPTTDIAPKVDATPATLDERDDDAKG
ncbi:MAG TPA: TolC family outer membrane protein [Xanthomonadales bacterium]|nr:TolC family outer membrane protein [Xanthomonadales bacterium]